MSEVEHSHPPHRCFLFWLTHFNYLLWNFRCSSSTYLHVWTECRVCWPVNQSPGGSSRAWSHCLMWCQSCSVINHLGHLLPGAGHQRIQHKPRSFISLTLWLLSLGAHQSSGEFSEGLGPAHVPRLGSKVSAGGSRHCFASCWLDFPPSGLLLCNMTPFLGEECSVSDASTFKGLFLRCCSVVFYKFPLLEVFLLAGPRPFNQMYTGTKWMGALPQ